MKSPLDILYLEDDARDADLVRETLESGDIACVVTRVDSEPGFREALQSGGYHLILADYTLPAFDGMSALKIARELRPELPFLFLSGTLDEELAIEALKRGATDYVFKTRLARIVPSVRRALREKEERAERARTEEALRRSEAYLAEAQKLSKTGSFGWDVATGAILNWSLETFRIFGMDPSVPPTVEETLERTHPDDRAFASRVIESTARERKSFDIEYRLLMPGGEIKHIRVVSHPSTGSEFVGAVTDITERKRSEDALRRSEAELAHVNRMMTMGELSASIAHEINQPLSSIVVNGSTCLRWLAGPEPNLEEAREAAQRIVRDGKRAGEVIARIRALTRKAMTERERLDVNGIIKDVVMLVRGELVKNRVALRTELHDGLQPVLGDRIQLQQLVINLIMNGIEAMVPVRDRPRELSISTRHGESDQVLVAVRDSGIGLDPESGERIFEAFYTTKPQGTGMGLSISRSIIQNHGGRLWATANDGPGTTFQFTVPACS